MGQCRDLLAVHKIADFKLWLDANDFEVRETSAPYSVFQVRIDGKGYEIYVRSNTTAGNKTVHASVYGPVIKLVQRFLGEQKQNDPT